MRCFKNVIILGTSHIAQESINQVEVLIEKEKPEIIALELDYLRFKKLMSKKKDKLKISQLASKGILFNVIGAYIEKKLGEKVGISPGSEMKTAIKSAKKNIIEIALIDQDIRITLKRLSKEFSLKEKLKFIKDILVSLVKRQKIKIDLTKVPSQKLIKKLIKDLKDKYPSLYKVLIAERNKVMANNITTIMKDSKKVLVIVGAGHEDDLIKLIKCNLAKKK